MLEKMQSGPLYVEPRSRQAKALWYEPADSGGGVLVLSEKLA